ncbi:dTDP-4-dehydrorhamnose 3,5-epimerase family protein [Acidobacteriia bacterium AH_259_A11_L15]|nr:dTDP-4-dehydrorhamnose 3,5-epimerase family protein [Acidobacteriia bacterium AH_259_A11_L15]
MITGVKVKALRVISDERGRLMEILRSDDELFIKFGQLYMTTAYPEVVKAWRGHRERVDNFVVVKGMIKLVLYDQREDSPTHDEVNEFFMGEHNPLLVQVPNPILHGYKCVGNEEAIVLNCCTFAYRAGDPDLLTVDPFSSEIPYNWSIKMK